MDSESPEQAPSQSHSSVQSNVRTKTDIGWDYATLVIDGNGKKSCICNFCNKVSSGGGINRVKKHLACYKGEVVACPKVVSDVRFTIQGNLKETAQKDKDESTFTISDEDEDMEETLRGIMLCIMKGTLDLCSQIQKQDPDVLALCGRVIENLRTDTADFWSTSSAADVCRCGPQTADVLTLKKQTAPKAYVKARSVKAEKRKATSNNEVVQGVLEMVEKYFQGQALVDFTSTLGHFRDATGTFGRPSAVASRSVSCPDEWWKLFGGDLPVLKKFKIDKKAFDPIDYENIDKTDFWVIQEEPEGDLDYNELENMLQEQEHEPASQSQETGSVTVDENEVDTEFQLLSDRVIDAYNTQMSEIP
ncbi:hypothetical protein LXL04_013332 [Taraxacum kok-saghyz]